ncbi:MAG TPA: Gfo/Idh/MocA family oxidoreductase [Casimicrobiaceae bacterium]|jgi:predicted dehydrogenase
MDAIRGRFGRPLRLAMIGGGPGAWIGYMHRTAAELDGAFRVVGGVFSSDAARSRSAGIELGFPADRCYGDAKELIAAERARSDGADAVAIVTSNDTHYPYAAAALDAGLDVMCDKPVTETLAQARDLAERTQRSGRLFAIAHGYSAYPMIRHARELVGNGAIGAVRLVQVEYIQSGLATRLEDAAPTTRLRWLLDPERSGLSLVMSAIGCHAQHLACFVTRQRVERVCADVRALMPGRKVHDYASALLEMHGGARGTFTATQAAAGAENDIRLRVYGERGMLEWWHRDCNYLRLALQGEPARVIGRGDPGVSPAEPGTARAPRGHPEGLREAFATLYDEFADDRMLRSLGETPSAPLYPTIADGVHTMAFIEACVASTRDGHWVDVVPTTASHVLLSTT